MVATQQRSGFAALVAALPRGGALPEHVWRARHQGVLVLLWIHVLALAAIGVVVDQSPANIALASGIVAACTVAAGWQRLSRDARASMATLGLLSSSAVLIGYFGGLIEAHFHFFIVIAVVSLYQCWRPYLIAVGFVLAHHLVLGTVLPQLVYNHHMALHHPWIFALIHALAVLAESIACLIFWKVTEDALDAERTSREALERANTELTEANSAVSDLVAMLSHDLRGPLTLLVGHSEMALESWPELEATEQTDFVRRVSRTGQDMHAMLEATLAVSALEGDGVEPRPTPVRLDEAVHAALEALPEPLPEVDLHGLRPLSALIDRSHLGQVLGNVLGNAAKYGGGRVWISTHAGDEHVQVHITDSGTGVPHSFVPRLFDRFARAEEAREGGQKGTGLGLYICRNLLHANGGDISYERAPNGGATFRLALPRADGPAGVAAQ